MTWLERVDELTMLQCKLETELDAFRKMKKEVIANKTIVTRDYVNHRFDDIKRIAKQMIVMCEE